MKKFIQYNIEEISKWYSFNKKYRGNITWFDGKQMVAMESPRLKTRIDCWKWVGVALKEFLKDPNFKDLKQK